jgi:hypothetical protein
MHLNGWQRIGVVISVLWAVGGGLSGNNLGLHEGDWVKEAYQDCLARVDNSVSSSLAASKDLGAVEKQDAKDLDLCAQTRDKAWPKAISNHWIYAAFFGLAPVLLGWFAVYGVIALVRWIRAGFKAPTGPDTNNSLSGNNPD